MLSDPNLAEESPLHSMASSRMEALTDGVVAIVITIMVIELKVPGSGWQGIRDSLPLLLAYALSFINVGLFWNNHHHLMQLTERIDGRVLWANLFHLFWLSLIPFTIRWLDESGFAPVAVAAFGVVIGMAAIGYRLIVRSIIACSPRNRLVAVAMGRDVKGRASILFYGTAIALAFRWPAVAIAIYCGVILLWLIPDRRIERLFDE